jgi:hypothetical protein
MWPGRWHSESFFDWKLSGHVTKINSGLSGPSWQRGQKLKYNSIRSNIPGSISGEIPLMQSPLVADDVLDPTESTGFNDEIFGNLLI